MKPSLALTVTAEIDRARIPELLKELARIDVEATAHPPGDPRPVLVPALIPDTHFTRWLIIDDVDADGAPRGLPPLLVWESNHDGERDDYLAAVARAVPHGLDRLYQFCVGYPASGAADVDGWVAWIRARAVRANAFYCAYRGVPSRQVSNDRRIRDRIRRYLDDHRPSLVGQAPIDIQRKIREHVAAAPDLDTSVQGEGELLRILKLVGAGLAALALSPLILIALPFWYVTLRGREQTDPTEGYDRPVHDDGGFRHAEDKITQNQLTHLVDLKPGRFRHFTLWVTLMVIDVLARFYFTRGALYGITSIHFARWVILRDPRPGVAEPRHRLLFFSNYDGSWDAYLGEFVDRAAGGLTAIWSNTVWFPRAKNLYQDGADDEEAFKQWARDHQISTHVWWSSVPDATVQNVRDDVWIRRRLGRPLSDTELPQWLRRL